MCYKQNTEYQYRHRKYTPQFDTLCIRHLPNLTSEPWRKAAFCYSLVAPAYFQYVYSSPAPSVRRRRLSRTVPVDLVR